MSLIIGWNKGGVGTSTLHKILKDAGVFIDKHKSELQLSVLIVHLNSSLANVPKIVFKKI